MASSPLYYKIQEFDANGNPLSGGTIGTYLTGTSTFASVFTDAAGTNAASQPVLLDARGEAVIYLDSTKVYKFVIKDSLGAEVRPPVDPVYPGLKSSDLASIPFQMSGLGTVVRTLGAKASERFTFEDLGCVGDGTANDGTTLTTQLYIRYGGLAISQSAVFLDIHGTFGKTYKLDTPIMVRQQRIRFWSNGSTLTGGGTTARAFDITQDGTANQNEQGMIDGFTMTGFTSHAVRARAAPFWTYSNNHIYNSGGGLDLGACVSPSIINNYIHNNTGHGILLQSAITVGGGVNETQHAMTGMNKIFSNGAAGIHCIDGGGHAFGNDDIEGNTGQDIRIQSSFGNTIIPAYIEPKAGNRAIQIDNTVGLVGAGRTSNDNKILGGLIGAGAVYDIDLQGASGTIIENITLGTGKINIAAAVTATTIGTLDGAALILTDAGSGTINKSGNTWTGIKAISSDGVPIKNPRGFVDFGAADTTKVITFAGLNGNEADGAYSVRLNCTTIGGTPAAGSKRISLSVFPANTGFTIANEAAPGGGASVRVWWEVYR
jgi:hypothetical protein